MTLFEYGLAVSWIEAMSSIGNTTRGSSAVTAMGTASVAHQTAIRMPIAAVRHAASLSPSGAPASNITIASSGPRNSPTHWCRARPSCCSSWVKPLTPSSIHRNKAQKRIAFVVGRRDFLRFIYILCIARLPIQDVVAFCRYQSGTHGDEMQ
jgi:hypothetical protein